MSYNRNDLAFVEKLVADLSEASVETWIDRRITSGRWDEIVQGALDSCEAMLLVLSRGSAKSAEVMNEVNYVYEKKPIVIVLVERPERTPYRLTSLHFLDFTHSYPLDDLVRALRNPLRKPGPSVDPAVAPFFPYLRKLVYEYEHWSEFNDLPASGPPRARKAMMISRMAAADLYRQFIPVGVESLPLGGRAGLRSFEDVEALETSWLQEPLSDDNPGFLLVLGDYGTGKSSCALHMAWRVARERLQDPLGRGPVPLYVDLRDFRSVGNAEEFLLKTLQVHYGVLLDLRQLLRLLAEGRLLPIFDGFDEMASRGDVSGTLANLAEIRRL